MANRTSINSLSDQFETDHERFELEPLEPRLLLSADPLGTQVAIDPGSLQPDRESTGAGLDTDSVTAFISALNVHHQDGADMNVALPASLDLDAVDTISPADNDSVLDYLAATSESLPDGDLDHSISARHEVIFIDSRTPDYEILLADVHLGDSGVHYDIIMLDANTDGIDQISDVLNTYHNLDAVHFISHASTDALQLGGTWLQSANLEHYASRIAGWQDHLGTEADMLFYGCNLAGSASGMALIDQLSRLTGADVAASDDPTGSALPGSDWELEYQVGAIETGIAVSDTAQQQWDYLLAAYVSQSSSNASAAFDSANAFGQSFVHVSGGGTYDIDYIGIELDRDGAASGTITVSLRDGWDGAVLASATKDASTLNESPTLEILNFAPVSLNDYQYYTIQVEVGPSSGTLNYGYDNTSPYFWGVFVQNGTSDFTSDLAFEVGSLAGSNSAPVQTVNTLDLAQGEIAVIDSTNLAATDVDSADGSLVFNISSASHGYFAYAADTSTAITSFTQDDITAGDIRFVHDGGELSPAFDVSVSDGSLATTASTATINFTGTSKGVLWLSLQGNEGTGSGIPGLNTTDIEDDDILQQADPNFSLGEATTNGTFSVAFNASDFAGNEDIKGMHYVTSTTTIGSTNAITLQAGDLLLTNRDGATFTSNGSGAPAPLDVTTSDIFFFRPDTPGDYSTGNFYMVLSDPFGDGSSTSALTLIERDVSVGGTNLRAGDVLLTSNDGSRQHSIWLLETSALDPTVTASYPAAKLLIDGADAGVDIENRIIGLDIFEQDTLIGGNSYDAGTLLVSFNADDIDGVGTTAELVSNNDIAALVVTKTSMETPVGNAQLTASIFFDGGNVNFDSDPERIDGFTLTPDIDSTNLPPVLGANNLVVNEGAIVTVTNTMLSASDVDSADTGLIFSVSTVNGGQFELTTDPGVEVTSFTQGQILANEVVFVDDGDENPPSFDVNVSDGTNTTANVAGVVTFGNTNDAPSISVPADVFINELHYDNTGVDVGEAVEVMGPAGTDLTGWSLVFYSGADSMTYHTEMLAGTIPNQADNFGTLAFTVVPIQNAGSAADGIALVNASSDVVQFISYEGTLTAANGPAAGLTSTDIGVAEDGATLVGDSLQLTGTGSDMTWMAASANTFGAPNTGQHVFARDTGTEDTDNVYTHGEMLALLGTSDPDDVDADLTVQITNVVNGTLTLSGGTGGLGTTFTFTPDPNFNGQLTFDYQVLDDDLAASATGNGIITIAPVNDNPTGSGSLTTTTVDDNAGAVNLFGALSVADADAGENDLVLRITLSVPTAGTITGGGFIDQGGGVYTASALTVAQANTALDDVQFTPVDNSGSTGSFTTDISVDVDDQGGAGYQPVLSATTVTINRVNDAPTATNLSSTSSYNEGDASVAITDIVVSDVDAGETITATLTLVNTATGSLSANDGATYNPGNGVWTLTNTVANVNTALANLVFTPAINNDIDTSISVVIDDGDEDASGPITGTITLDVTPVNDLPTSADNSVITLENVSISFSASDFVFTDVETAGIVALRIDSLPVNGALTNGTIQLNPGDVVLAADLANLTYTPNTNYNGPDSFTFSVSDGTDYSVNPNTMTITVSAVNNVPTSMDTTTSTNEDVTRVFGAADFPYADVESPSIVALRIDSLPASGVLMNGASVVNAGDVVVAADLDQLRFTPAADFSGTDSFTFSVFDGNDYSTAASTMTIAVNAINDVPTSGDFSISTTENVASTFTASDFPFADVETAGIVALRIDAIPGNGVLMNGTTVVNAGDVVLAADLGKLRYTPDAGFNGSDTFSFSVSDGTAYSSSPSTVTANVNPAAMIAAVSEPPAEPIFVARPDVSAIDPAAEPGVAETPAANADTVSEDVTEDQTASQNESANVAETPVILIAPDDAGIPENAVTPPDYDSNQRIGVDTGVKVSLKELLQAIQIQLPGWDNLQQYAGELFDPMNLLESKEFSRDMDQLREEAQEDVVSHKMKAGGGVVVTTSLTIGYVAYLVRGGVLLSSVLSALPVWNFIDPTPILASVKSSTNDDDKDDDSLESLVTQNQPVAETEEVDVNKEAGI